MQELKQKEIKDLINQLKLLLNISEKSGIEIRINEGEEVMTVTIKQEDKEGEVFRVIPK